ncbi:MAG TPA: periplasmic heavy metal sensor [Polyangiaceae bacterium]|nr:periplasmic heavy metal sensor [Polyangiaceae bacterium]
MFGFVIAIGCLIGLFAVLRHGKRHRSYGGWGHGEHWGRFGLNALFDRLGTSNAQEKVILAAVSDVQGQLAGLRGGLREARSTVAQALREEQFNAERVGAALAQREVELAQLRQSVVTMLATVHETLDPQQRQQLGRLVEESRLAEHYHHGHYRGCGPCVA